MIFRRGFRPAAAALDRLFWGGVSGWFLKIFEGIFEILTADFAGYAYFYMFSAFFCVFPYSFGGFFDGFLKFLYGF